MKIITMLFLAMLMLSGLSQAQVVDPAAFSKAVDYANCKTIELSLINEPTIYQQYLKECPCSVYPAYPNIAAFLKKIGKHDRNLQIAAEIDSLKQTVKGISKDSAVTLLSENIFTNKVKFQKTVDFASSRNGNANFKKLKEQLQSELPKLLADPLANAAAGATLQANFENQVRTIVDQELKAREDAESRFKGFVFQIDILSILIAVGSILLLMRIIKKYTRRSRHHSGSSRSSHSNDSNSNKVTAMPTQKQDPMEEINKNLIKTLKDKIEKLEVEVRELRSKIEGRDIPLATVPSKPTSQAAVKTKQSEPKKASEIFFIATPEADGSFNESSISPIYKEGASIYRFNKLSAQRAEFQIDEREASVKLALQYPDLRIEPCCIPLNAYNPKAKRIVTQKSGMAELSNDKWEITAKAEISYEV